MIRARAAVAQMQLRVATEQQEAEVALREWESLGEGEPTDLVLRKPQLARWLRPRRRSIKLFLIWNAPA